MFGKIVKASLKDSPITLVAAAFCLFMAYDNYGTDNTMPAWIVFLGLSFWMLETAIAGASHLLLTKEIVRLRKIIEGK